MNDTFGNTLVIEMRNFFAEDKILKKCRSTRIGLKRVLVIGNGKALIRGERLVISTSYLMQLAAGRSLRISDRSRVLFLFVDFRITRCLFLVHDWSPCGN